MKNDVAEALKKARHAQAKWSQTTFLERRNVLRALLDFIVKNQEEICWVSCRDTGKTCNLSHLSLLIFNLIFYLLILDQLSNKYAKNYF